MKYTTGTYIRNPLFLVHPKGLFVQPLHTVPHLTLTKLRLRCDDNMRDGTKLLRLHWKLWSHHKKITIVYTSKKETLVLCTLIAATAAAATVDCLVLKSTGELFRANIKCVKVRNKLFLSSFATLKMQTMALLESLSVEKDEISSNFYEEREWNCIQNETFFFTWSINM